MRSFLIPTAFISVMILAGILLLSLSINQEVMPVGDETGYIGEFPVVPNTNDYGPLQIAEDNDVEFIVKDFLDDSSVSSDKSNSGQYFLGNTFEDAVNGNLPPYIIVYDANNSYFNVALLQKPFKRSRTEAELYLSNLLEVNEASLCKLRYTVSIPAYVDENASGIDYRFSSCRDSIKLP